MTGHTNFSKSRGRQECVGKKLALQWSTQHPQFSHVTLPLRNQITPLSQDLGGNLAAIKHLKDSAELNST